MSADLRHLYLGHLSRECNRPELAHRVVSERLQKIGANHVKLELTSQAHPCQTFCDRLNRLSLAEDRSFDLPELQPYRTMRRQHEHRQQGIFVAEGEKVVRRLLESSFGVVSVLLPEKWLHELDPLLQARPEEIRVFVAEKALLETLTGFSMYQGLLAVGKIPPLPTLEEIVARSPQPRLLAAADGLTNAENLGALVRNCAAFNAQALIVGETCSSPFLRRAVRSSMGTIFQMPSRGECQPGQGPRPL